MCHTNAEPGPSLAPDVLDTSCAFRDVFFMLVTFSWESGVGNSYRPAKWLWLKKKEKERKGLVELTRLGAEKGCEKTGIWLFNLTLLTRQGRKDIQDKEKKTRPGNLNI